MLNLLRKFVKAIIPYGLILWVRKYREKIEAADAVIHYSGDYASWRDAQADSTGYDSDLIIDKVLNSTQAVIDGNAVYEQDSCLFYKENYNYPLIAALLYVAGRCNSVLNVLDFGGALGSTYWQNHKLLESVIQQLTWNIVEQPKFVSASSQLHYKAPLFFYPDIKSVIQKQSVNVILLSSVLQYIEDWRSVLNSLPDFDYLIIDRQPEFISKTTEQITVQTVREPIYFASYPLHVFEKNHWEKYFEDCKKIMSWVSPVDNRYAIKDRTDKTYQFQHIGILFAKKKK